MFLDQHTTWTSGISLALPSVIFSGLPARILPEILRIPEYSCQESYQDLARSWNIVQEIQETEQAMQGYFPRFCRSFQDAVLDFPVLFQEFRGLFLKVLN